MHVPSQFGDASQLRAEPSHLRDDVLGERPWRRPRPLELGQNGAVRLREPRERDIVDPMVVSHVNSKFNAEASYSLSPAIS